MIPHIQNRPKTRLERHSLCEWHTNCGPEFATRIACLCRLCGIGADNSTVPVLWSLHTIPVPSLTTDAHTVCALLSTNRLEIFVWTTTFTLRSAEQKPKQKRHWNPINSFLLLKRCAKCKPNAKWLDYWFRSSYVLNFVCRLMSDREVSNATNTLCVSVIESTAEDIHQKTCVSPKRATDRTLNTVWKLFFSEFVWIKFSKTVHCFHNCFLRNWKNFSEGKKSLNFQDSTRSQRTIGIDFFCCHMIQYYYK